MSCLKVGNRVVNIQVSVISVLSSKNLCSVLDQFVDELHTSVFIAMSRWVGCMVKLGDINIVLMDDKLECCLTKIKVL